MKWNQERGLWGEDCIILEKQIIQSSPHKPLSWFCFIDDVDTKWIQSQEYLHRLIDHANNVHPTIKFTHETSRTTISFLNTSTTCGIMSTDIYNKLTDKHRYLSPRSCHPKHCSKSILYSQALRIKRICSNEQTTKKRLGELKYHLKRGVTTMLVLTFVLTKQVALTEKISSNIKKRTQTTECHLSSHYILGSVIYPKSFVSTRQPYKIPSLVQNIQRTTRLSFQEIPRFEGYLGESRHLPPIRLQWWRYGQCQKCD